MKLIEVFDKDNISFDIDLKNREDVLDYLVSSLYETNVIRDETLFKEAVMYRESLSETGLGGSIAIPHGKSEVVNKAGIAFVRLSEEVSWPSLDGDTAKYIFLLAIPDNNDNNEHIKLISELSRSLIRDEVIEAITKVNSSDELLEIL